MSWEFKVLEPIDYGHPGGSTARYEEFEKNLAELCNDGWEIVQMVPSMIRGRITASGRDEMLNLTTVAMIALLRRKVDK